MKFEYALIALCAVASLAPVSNTALIFITLFGAFAVKVTESLLERREHQKAAHLAAVQKERNLEAARALSEGVVERVAALETKVSNLTLKGLYDKSNR